MVIYSLFIHKRMRLTQQQHHISLTSFTNTWHSLNKIITSSSLHTQTHDTQSTTSSHHPLFIHKRMTLTQQLHHIILTSTQTHDTQSTTSSHHPHFIHKHMTLTQQHQTSSHHPNFIHKHMTLTQQLHYIILTSFTNTWHSLNKIITSSSLH